MKIRNSKNVHLGMNFSSGQEFKMMNYYHIDPHMSLADTLLYTMKSWFMILKCLTFSIVDII